MKFCLQLSVFWQMEIYCQIEIGNEYVYFGVLLKIIYVDLGVGCQGCGFFFENLNYEINIVRYFKIGLDFYEK